MEPTNSKTLYSQVRDASNSPESFESREPQEAGYALAPREIRAHYNADGSMKEEFKGQYLFRGYTAQQIQEFEFETYRELQVLTAQREAYERNYGCDYPVEDLGKNEPPEQMKRVVNLRAIREGEGLTELPYAMETADYYDIKAGSPVNPLEETNVYQLYPEVFVSDRQGNEPNSF
ncbi:hypothetical protein [Laspinema olomoucense]|uniref:hypothetical protein n=1 Tax=Laspinema olomoucense TaxID=3231600 RepID=UPI0021BAC50B|nr:hypothetical protein [Laspinema sp. D3a]MCT7989076.1 hypothetical protein [Laspinema sp. D3a]